MAELQIRLERLPDGHPSSPYNDDGTRKAPVVRLKDLELPLPGEERPPAGGAKHDLFEARPLEPAADRQRTADTSHVDDQATSGGSSAADHDETAARDERLEESSEFQPGNPDGAGGPGSRTPDGPDSTGPENPGPRTGADGSWELKGLRLTPEQCRIADVALDRCRAAEGRSVFDTYGDEGLTPAMRHVEAQLEHGRLAPDTEKFALKSADRFKEKLAKLIARNPDKPPQSLAHEVHDAVRYTYVFDVEHYTEGTWQAHRRLHDQGFEVEVRRNSWENPEYKGINSRWHDPEHDLLFEVQFHTSASWAAKQRTHDAYERIADPRTPQPERARLRADQVGVSAAIPVPPRCMEISDYRKEGR